MKKDTRFFVASVLGIPAFLGFVVLGVGRPADEYVAVEPVVESVRDAVVVPTSTPKKALVVETPAPSPKKKVIAVPAPVPALVTPQPTPTSAPTVVVTPTPKPKPVAVTPKTRKTRAS